MSLLFCVRRVSLSQSFNTLRRLRHLTTESCTGRVLFFAQRTERGVLKEQHFYSVKIQKGDTDNLLRPAIKLPRIPFKSLTLIDLTQVRNGLLCHREGSQFYIFSPDTGVVSTLPDLPTLDFPCEPFGFDNDLIHYFGFDPLSNEPKVLLLQTVYVPRGRGSLKRVFWVFTRGSGSWNRIHPSPLQESFIDSFDIDFKDAVFANGTIHWIYDNVEDHYDAYSYPRKYILAFDMVEEKFRKIPYPDDSFSGELATFGGRLALIERYYEIDMSRERFAKLECWILEDNHKWVKETIHFPFGWRKHMKVLAFDSNTGEMLLWREKCLFFYNTKTRIFRIAELTGFPEWCHLFVPHYLKPVDVSTLRSMFRGRKVSKEKVNQQVWMTKDMRLQH